MTQEIQASVNSDLDQMLEDACEGMQLTETQLTDAQGHYEAVGEWLSDLGSPLHRYRPEIKPYGSISQGTVVRPRGKDEFDIDLACILTSGTATGMDPNTVYDMVLGRLRANGLYQDKIQTDARCITLEYANDFCLDIIPAVPSSTPSSESLFIPDRQLQEWKPTDPLGFTKWFKEQIERHRPVEMTRLSASVEPIKTEEIAVSALQRATQLFKRRRDVFYGDKDRPSSLLLTVLAGTYYAGGNPTCDALLEILDGVVRLYSSTSTPPIPNPVDLNENLTANWSLKEHQEFSAFIGDFATKMRSLLVTRGLEHIGAALADLFGKRVAENVITRRGKRFQAQRESGRLRATKNPSALIASVASCPKGKPIPRNSFYGN